MKTPPSFKESTRLSSFIERELSKDRRHPIGPETPLVSSGLVDSLALVSVLAFVEDEFGVVIPDEAATAAAMDSVARILELVRTYRGF